MTRQNSLMPRRQPAEPDLRPAPASNLSRDLTNTDVQRIQASLDRSVSANTRAMYASAWRAFQAWTRARGGLAMPASPPLVAAYLGHLAGERRLSVATLRLHKAALAAMHRAAGHDDPNRQRRRETGHAGHLQDPRQGPETGQTPDRGGPWRRQGHNMKQQV